MRITNDLRKQINARVRALCGANPLAEVGLRGSDGTGYRPWLPNALNWTKDDDLGDLCRLADLREIDEHTERPNEALLDLYVTSGIGMNRELETNVYVWIRDGRVVEATTQDLKVKAMHRQLGFAPGHGWVLEG